LGPPRQSSDVVEITEDREQLVSFSELTADAECDNPSHSDLRTAFRPDCSCWAYHDERAGGWPAWRKWRMRLRRGVQRCCRPAAGRRGLGRSGRVRASPCPDLRGAAVLRVLQHATFKAWVGSVVLALAAAQAGTALWLYGRSRAPPGRPDGSGRVHQTTGSVAFVVSLPVAAYCLYGGFAPAPLSARGAPEVGAPGDRSAAAHRGRGGVADQRPVALLGRRSPPVTGSRGFTWSHAARWRSCRRPRMEFCGG
jgi:hypothetical protein